MDDKKSIFDFLHFLHPTSEQHEVLEAMSRFIDSNDPYDFIILSGAAGTGKTSVTSALIGYLNHLKRSYKIAAPTGRAARILGRKSRSTASTIHSLIYIAEANSADGKVKFKLKNAYNHAPVIYIIDEASMIPKFSGGENALFETERGLILDLIAYVKGAHLDNKIIFLGDRYQLPPIGESESSALDAKFLEETFNLKGLEFRLTEVKRQSDGSYILENATEIRKAIDDQKQTAPIAGFKYQNIYQAADKFTREAQSKGPEHAVAIGVSNKANRFFNDLVRQRMFGWAKQVIEQGDLMMLVQNWTRNGAVLYNGDHVVVEDVDWNIQEEVADLHFIAVKIRLLFAEEETIVDDYAMVESILSPGGRLDAEMENNLRNQRYIKNKLFRDSMKPEDDRYVGALRLTYGHAITCNKAQGGEWTKVLINTLGIPSLKWQYTAITRGIDDLEKF